MTGKHRPTPSMEGCSVVVTGGNSGVGQATATALAAAGAHTVITARSEERGRQAVERIRRAVGVASVDLVVFDLADLASVRRGAEQILERCARIDVLVNNAGLILSKRSESVDGFESTFATNHLGPFYLTRLLTGRLIASAPARVVNVSSVAHQGAQGGLDFADLQSTRRYRGMRTYSRSKLANLLFTTELAGRLADRGVTVNALHPGAVATGFARDDDAAGLLKLGITLIKPFILTPEKGARTSVYLATSPAVAAVSGKYFVRCRQRATSVAAQDPVAAAFLWSISEELVERAVGPAAASVV